MAGLNAKLSEVGALLALKKLEEFDAVIDHRARLAETYRAELPGWVFQTMVGSRHAYQFMPVLLPADCRVPRADIVARLATQGVGAAHYFSPHLAEQPCFRKLCASADLPVTDRIAARILSLPLSDEMTYDDVATVCSIARDCLRREV